MIATIVERLTAALKEPLPDENDVLAWNVETIRRCAIAEARNFYYGVAYVVQCKSAAAFDERQFAADENSLRAFAELMCRACDEIPEAERAAAFAFAREMLRTSGDLYFNLLGAAFPAQKVSACHLLFSAVVSRLGTREAVEQSAALVEERCTMCREINALANKADISGRIDALMVKMEEAEKDHAKFYRTQSEALRFIKQLIKGFIALFRPDAPKPDDRQVQHTLMPINKYACLSRVPYPHNIQVKAVIDYTWDVRPIVHKASRKKRDAYSLAFAARDVWAARHNDWDKIPGTFRTSKDLYSACNNLQNKDDDPFKYEEAK